MNIELSAQLVRALAANGVRDFCVCAGARNAPLVAVLDRAVGINVQSFFDERAAAYFALGRAKRDGRPVAVVTTSGTAVAELLPAAVEAHYSGYPIVLISADRPRSHRGKSSPQAIEQVGIFSHYANPCYDIEGQLPARLDLNHTGATHINVCFDEPLMDGVVPQLNLRPGGVTPNPTAGGGESERFKQFFARVKRPLCLVGGVPDSVRGRVLEFLSMLGAPVYLEAISGLREDSRLAPLQLRSGVVGLDPRSFRRHFDGVLRIGSVPTLRLWRDLDAELRDVPVLSVSALAYSGLGREIHPALTWSALQGAPRFSVSTELQKEDRAASRRLVELLAQFPESEPALVGALSSRLEPDSNVFLGNSLPIREWDLAATFETPHPWVAANRGANGIDGLISTFLGWCRDDRPNHLLLGDLSALYDLNALTVATSAPRVCISIINNSGGQIFRRMFQNSRFLNSHELNFAKWAEMFGFSYRRVVRQAELTGPFAPPSRAVIEIVPDSAQTEEFWRCWLGATA